MLALVGFLNTLNLKLLERRSIKTSKKGIVPLDYNSKVNLREGYKLLMKSKNECKLKEFGTKDKTSSTYLSQREGLTPGYFGMSSDSTISRNKLAKIGERGDPIAMPNCCS